MKTMHAAARRLRALAPRALIGLALLAAVAGGAAATGFDYGAAIDSAGRQRMLSQRMVKAYAQVGLGVTPAVSRAQLDGAVRRFDGQLAALSRGAPTAAARRDAAALAALWKPMRALARGPVTRDNARRLLAAAESVLPAAHQLVLTLQAAAATSEARLVNISGRQRMLSQRLAMLYMLRAWGAEAPETAAQIDAGGAEFTAALAELRAAPENTPEIARELDAVQLQWEWFRAALLLQGAESHVHIVADASEAILSSMELVTAKYAALPRR